MIQSPFQLNETKLYAKSAKKQQIEEALSDYAKGKFILVSDDEDRENEGDLIISAQFATKEAINFMISEGKGLVCVAISEEIASYFQLAPMVQRNCDQMGTAFTVSVDAGPEYGVTTGISAWDRARTIEVLLDGSAPTSALRAPGHIFPLLAKPGGVQQRQGHTEAAVTMSKLVGHKPAGVIVEVIKEDGEMARRDDLIKMAGRHNIKYTTIADLVRYCDYLEEAGIYQAAEKVGKFGSFVATEV